MAGAKLPSAVPGLQLRGVAGALSPQYQADQGPEQGLGAAARSQIPEETWKAALVSMEALAPGDILLSQLFAEVRHPPTPPYPSSSLSYGDNLYPVMCLVQACDTLAIWASRFPEIEPESESFWWKAEVGPRGLERRGWPLISGQTDRKGHSSSYWKLGGWERFVFVKTFRELSVLGVP